MEKVPQLARRVHLSRDGRIPMTIFTNLRARGKGLAQGFVLIVPTCL
jgi:hypothetical protein